MANFCTNCGRQLSEGEICGCTNQHNQQNGQQMNQQVQGGQQQIWQQPPNYSQVNQVKDSSNSKMISIGQIVVGGLLVAIAMITLEYDWGLISLVSGGGFLWTGIISVVSKK